MKPGSMDTRDGYGSGMENCILSWSNRGQTNIRNRDRILILLLILLIVFIKNMIYVASVVEYYQESVVA